jgi:pantoate kinase
LLPRDRAVAFAPAAITNFFSISYSRQGTTTLPKGATGGGYVLSKGVVSEAIIKGGTKKEIFTEVNGDSSYDARTTRTAIGFLVAHHRLNFDRIELRQSVGVPIGAGFGASAASALSAVFSVASAFRLSDPKAALARFAHDAELAEQTGLGTVSVTYDGVGAGAIVKPGVPGVAKFVNVKVPVGTRLVTASLAPYRKKDAFSSAELSLRIVRYGDQALERFRRSPSFDTLGACGEWFASKLGLANDEIVALTNAAKGAGAYHASQNMIGLAVHSLADEDSSMRVVDAYRATGLNPRIDIFEIGRARAGPLK